MSNVRSRNILTCFVLLIGSLFGLAGSACAQQYLGTLSGSVSDASGAKVAGAQVEAIDVTTNFVSKVVTNSSGEYTIPFLTPDTYTVTITSSSFRPATRTSIVLTAGATQQVDFTLQVGAQTDTVVVTADTQLLDTTSANLATTFSTEEVTDTPNVGRNPFVLSTLAAGVFSAGSGGYFQGKASTFTNPFSGAAVQVDSNGSSGHNRLTLDGSPDDPSERFSGSSYTGFVPSPEAVQEVKVQTAEYDAQYGHGDGVVTNTVLRAGSNHYHGSVYDVFRNTYMNANTYERVPTQNSAPTGVALTPRGTDQWEQPGFVIDGPLSVPKLYNAKDRTFFMVAYEYLQLKQTLPYSTLVPTKSGGLSGLGNIGGDFSNLCSVFNASGVCTSGIQIYDPLSVPNGSTANRTPFAFNLIPSGRINAAGAAYLGLMPAPNANLTSAINYISSHTSVPNRYFSIVSRVDHQFSEKQHFDVTFFKANLHQFEPNEGFPTAIGPTGDGYTVFRNNAGGNIEDSYALSPTLLVNARFGLIYHPFGLFYPGSNFNLASIGINASGLPYQSFPGSTFTDNYLAQGTTADGLAAGNTGQNSEDTLGSASLLVAKSIQSHSLRFGFEGNLSRYNVQNPQSGLGVFTYNRQFTQQNSSGVAAASCPAAPASCVTGSDPNSGNAIADLLLGYPSSGSYANTIAFALQQKYIAFFAQDDWRVSSKLTVNAGLRWDYESPFSERFNRLNAGFCLTCTNPIQSNVTGLATPGGLTFVNSTSNPSRYSAPQKYTHFQPRFGAAYQVTPKIVARAGLGLVYFNTQDSPASQASGYSQTTSYVQNGTVYPTNSLSNPFPGGVIAPTGNTLGLGTLLGQSVSFPDPNSEQPKMWQYSLSLQFQLPASVALQLAYVGNKVSQLPINKQIDVLPASYFGTAASPANTTALLASVANPLAGQLAGSSLNGATVQQYLLDVPYPEFTGVTDNYIPAGSALYNALQITARKPLSRHFEIQGNFTWEKIMDQNVYLNPQATTPFRYQDSQPNLVANVWGTYHLPGFEKLPIYGRELLGGWKVQAVLRAANGPLVGSIPNNTGSQYGTAQTYTMLRNPKLPNPNRSLQRYLNTCYENAAGALVYTTVSASGAVIPGCDSTNNNVPAFQLNPEFTLATVGPELNIREQVHPLVDTSLFKTFQIHEGINFEIRGEFFNVFNTPNFGGPGLTPGSSTYGVVTLTQLNDPRLTQLTARINF